MLFVCLSYSRDSSGEKVGPTISNLGKDKLFTKEEKIGEKKILRANLGSSVSGCLRLLGHRSLQLNG